MPHTANALLNCLYPLGSSAPPPVSAEATPWLRPRWMPRRSIDTGALVGAECVIASPTDPDVDPATRLAAPSTIATKRAALEAAMSLVDDLLLRHRPLPLSVPMSSADFADPAISNLLRSWSVAHGGAHRLLGFEIDAADLHRLSGVDRVVVANLGYEVTLCRAVTVGPEARALGVSRLAFPPNLIRWAKRDPDAAAMTAAFADRARAQGLEPVLKGLDHDRDRRLLDLVAVGSWQAEPEVLSVDDDGLFDLAHDDAARRAIRRRDGSPTAPTWGSGDLTWAAPRVPTT